MITLAPSLAAASAGIILLLGLVHLLFTFHGPKLLPRDAALMARMKEVSPILTDETTMWKTWVGFNASHSFGAILFGLVYGYFAVAQSAFLFQSRFLLAVGLAFLGGLFFLGERIGSAFRFGASRFPRGYTLRRWSSN